MKKSISIVLIVLLVAGVLFLTGCGKKEEENNAKKGETVNLTYDFTHMNDKTYDIKFNIAEDIKVAEFDKDEPNYVRMENEKENYVLDLELSSEAKDAYKQIQTSISENEVYEEVKFGKYEGFYSDDLDGTYGYILLDSSDETFNIYLAFVLYLDDESKGGNTVELYKSANVQNILNNIEFAVK